MTAPLKFRDAPSGRLRPPIVVAHRGDSVHAPENTLAAFRAAIRAGAHAVEFDVHRTADGFPIVFHDYTLARTTGARGRVSDHTAAQLRRLSAGTWFSPSFRNERIPTLRAALQVMRGRIPVLNVEIKGRHPALVAAVRREVERLGLTRRTVVSSFRAAIVERVRREWPQVRAAWNVSRWPAPRVSRAKSLGAAGLHPHRRWVTGDRVARAHAAGLWVWAWTADDPAELARLAACGVDGIFSNDPGRARRALGR